jgi:hypothetical protein
MKPQRFTDGFEARSAHERLAAVRGLVFRAGIARVSG